MVFTCQYCKNSFTIQDELTRHQIQCRCPDTKDGSNNPVPEPGPSSIPPITSNGFDMLCEAVRQACRKRGLADPSAMLHAIKSTVENNIKNGMVEKRENVVNQHNNTVEHNFTNNFNIYVKYNIMDMNRYINQMLITRVPMSLIYQVLNWSWSPPPG